jgi:hypothetical protein
MNRNGIQVQVTSKKLEKSADRLRVIGMSKANVKLDDFPGYEEILCFHHASIKFTTRSIKRTPW